MNSRESSSAAMLSPGAGSPIYSRYGHLNHSMAQSPSSPVGRGPPPNIGDLLEVRTLETLQTGTGGGSPVTSGLAFSVPSSPRGGQVINYQLELARLLSKSKGTAYEATLKAFLEAKIREERGEPIAASQQPSSPKKAILGLVRDNNSGSNRRSAAGDSPSPARPKSASEQMTRDVELSQPLHRHRWESSHQNNHNSAFAFERTGSTNHLGRQRPAPVPASPSSASPSRSRSRSPNVSGMIHNHRNSSRDSSHSHSHSHSANNSHSRSVSLSDFRRWVRGTATWQEEREARLQLLREKLESERDSRGGGPPTFSPKVPGVCAAALRKERRRQAFLKQLETDDEELQEGWQRAAGVIQRAQHERQKHVTALQQQQRQFERRQARVERGSGPEQDGEDQEELVGVRFVESPPAVEGAGSPTAAAGAGAGAGAGASVGRSSSPGLGSGSVSLSFAGPSLSRVLRSASPSPTPAPSSNHRYTPASASVSGVGSVVGSGPIRSLFPRRRPASASADGRSHTDESGLKQQQQQQQPTQEQQRILRCRQGLERAPRTTANRSASPRGPASGSVLYVGLGTGYDRGRSHSASGRPGQDQDQDGQGQAPFTPAIDPRSRVIVARLRQREALLADQLVHSQQQPTASHRGRSKERRASPNRVGFGTSSPRRTAVAPLLSMGAAAPSSQAHELHDKQRLGLQQQQQRQSSEAVKEHQLYLSMAPYERRGRPAPPTRPAPTRHSHSHSHGHDQRPKTAPSPPRVRDSDGSLVFTSRGSELILADAVAASASAAAAAAAGAGAGAVGAYRPAAAGSTEARRELSVERFLLRRILADRAVLDGCSTPAPGQYTPDPTGKFNNGRDAHVGALYAQSQSARGRDNTAAPVGSKSIRESPGRGGYSFSRSARRTSQMHEVGAVEAVSTLARRAGSR